MLTIPGHTHLFPNPQTIRSSLVFHYTTGQWNIVHKHRGFTFPILFLFFIPQIFLLSLNKILALRQTTTAVEFTMRGKPPSSIRGSHVVDLLQRTRACRLRTLSFRRSDFIPQFYIYALID